jgi:hypothetical protein
VGVLHLKSKWTYHGSMVGLNNVRTMPFFPKVTHCSFTENNYSCSLESVLFYKKRKDQLGLFFSREFWNKVVSNGY